jgi:signal transduction histidine kinase
VTETVDQQAGPSSRRLPAREQDALRRVATLVADGAAPADLFSAIVEEVVAVLDVPCGWLFRYEQQGTVYALASSGVPDYPAGSRIPLDGPSVAVAVLETGAPARIDEYAGLDGTLATLADKSGLRSALGVPVTVDGAVWGVLCAAATRAEHLPADAEDRLTRFTELAMIAIASAESRDRLGHIADEQVALRRAATLVAEGASITDLFAVIADEIVRVLNVEAVAVFRYDRARTTTVVASLNVPEFPVGSSWPLDGASLSSTVFETGRPARIDDYGAIESTLAAHVRESRVQSTVGVPILVDGSVWGMIATGVRPRLPGGPEVQPQAAGVEGHLADFAELAAIAISNTESRDRLRRLGRQQEALRRVATLVAEGSGSTELFHTVVEEIARILDLASVSIVRYTPDGGSVVLASFNDAGFPAGSRWEPDPTSLNARVLETARPARIDDFTDLDGPIAAAARTSGVQFGLGVPIVVDGTVWGMIAAGGRKRRESLPLYSGSYTGRVVLGAEPTDEIEARLAAFTQLVATAISRAQSQDELRRLADEQGALRRVATLVAQAVPPEDVFAAVSAEVAQLLDVSGAQLDRFEPDGSWVLIAKWHDPDWEAIDRLFPVGKAWHPDAGSLTATVYATRSAARIDDYTDVAGEIGASARAARIGSACAAPIVVDGELWGSISVCKRLGEDLPADTESRLRAFTEMVATAVSNATARVALLESRARIVEAGDEARRRIERDLHDGTQQRLLAIGLDLQRVRAMAADDPQVRAELEEVERDLVSVLDEVREISRGLHPAQLSRGGLPPSLRALARRCPIPVDLEVDLAGRLPASGETAVYYVVSEALANAIKHSGASAVTVRVSAESNALRATVTDDGDGGAAAGVGSGLTGLRDRVEALGGRFELDSPPGGGTTVSVELPIATQAARTG